MQCMVYIDLMCWLISGGGGGRGFLEKGLICIMGFRFADLSNFYQICNENEIIWSL